MRRLPEQLVLDTRPATPPPGRASSSSRRHAIETGRNRLLVTGSVFAVLFLVLAVRLVHVSLLKGAGEPSLAVAAGTAPAAAERADILDRRGELLATNLATASLYANPRVILAPAEAALKLSRVLPELNHESLLEKLDSDRGFVWIKRNLTPKQQYAVNSLGLPGLAFQAESRRVYPQGRLTAHVLGFTGVDDEGLAGIEKYLDKRLSARRVRQGPLTLSLDVRAQYALRDELARAVAQYRAAGGAGVVLDAVNGEVLALVSLPDFDPNRVAAASEQARFNRATLGVYELGSVFKIFTLAMALDSRTVGLSDSYDATKPIHVARFVIHDFHPEKRWLSVPEIFMYSSNIGAARMALDVGGVAQREYLDRLGLLGRSAIELPEVGLPLYPSRWGKINTMTIAFGHGIAVSALQIASAAAAVVNGGVLVPASLIKREAGAEVPGRRVMSPETSATMRRLLRLVVEHGTGKKAAVPGYLVGGKTGTGEKAGPGGYRRKALVSSFVGAFPMTAPRYVVLALLDEPKGNEASFGFATGGWTAAPVVGRVIARIAPILGVAPVDEAAPEIRRAMVVTTTGGKAKLASF